MGVTAAGVNSMQAAAAMAANQPLDKDSGMLAIIRAMKKVDSGLEVRDRMWLKIKIPNAFLGSDMVDWLFEKVEGFQVRTSTLNAVYCKKIKCIVNISEIYCTPFEYFKYCFSEPP